MLLYYIMFVLEFKIKGFQKIILIVSMFKLLLVLHVNSADLSSWNYISNYLANFGEFYPYK